MVTTLATTSEIKIVEEKVHMNEDEAWKKIGELEEKKKRTYKEIPYQTIENFNGVLSVLSSSMLLML